MEISELLKERGKVYGDFSATAYTAQSIKTIVDSPEMNVQMREALDMIATKLARIVCGNPSHIDHWRDIAGYAQLVVDSLTPQPAEKPEPATWMSQNSSNAHDYETRSKINKLTGKPVKEYDELFEKARACAWEEQAKAEKVQKPKTLLEEWDEPTTDETESYRKLASTRTPS